MSQNFKLACGFKQAKAKYMLLKLYYKNLEYFKEIVSGTLRQVFMCLRPPLLLGFCLGWSSNFEGFESGQIQSFKLLQNMVSNMTQHSQAHLPATHCLYILYFDTGKGWGRAEPERRLKRQQFTKLGRKYQHEWMYLQSISCDKHLPQSPLQVNFFYDDILLWCTVPKVER
jgi:hypothetical protein